MKKNLKYFLYILVPLVVYFILLVIIDLVKQKMEGGCNSTGIPFAFVRLCTGALLGQSTVTWNFFYLALDIIIIYLVTAAVFYFLEKKR